MTQQEELAEALAEAATESGEGAVSRPAADRILGLGWRLLSEHTRLERLVEHVPAVLYIDRMAEPGSGRYPTLYVGPQVEGILGITAEEWTEQDELWSTHMHPDDWESVSFQYEQYLRRGGVLVQEYRIIRPDTGATIWVRDDCTISEDPTSGERLVFGVMFDITAQKDLEAQLRAAEAKNRVLIEQIPSVVWVEPLEDNCEPPYVSGSVRDVFGVGREQWVGTGWWERHLHPTDRDRVLAARRATEAAASALHIEYRMTTDDDRTIWIEEVSQVVTHDGHPWILQGLLDDITARKQVEQGLEFRAYHDPLTGLANRPLFDQSLDQALARANRQGTEVAVLFVDVDDFKRINDLHGHESGDEVLRVIAARLERSARASDLVARRGGDEYLILLADLERADPAGVTTSVSAAGHAAAEHLTTRIREAMTPPIEVEGGSVFMSLSIGQCVYPTDASDARAMMAAADAAMYRAKQGSRPSD